MEEEHLIIDGQVDTDLTDNIITESMFVTTNEHGDIIETTAEDMAQVQMVKLRKNNKKAIAKRSQASDMWADLVSQ